SMPRSSGSSRSRRGRAGSSTSAPVESSPCSSRRAGRRVSTLRWPSRSTTWTPSSRSCGPGVCSSRRSIFPASAPSTASPRCKATTRPRAGSASGRRGSVTARATCSASASRCADLLHAAPLQHLEAAGHPPHHLDQGQEILAGERGRLTGRLRLHVLANLFDAEDEVVEGTGLGHGPSLARLSSVAFSRGWCVIKRRQPRENRSLSGSFLLSPYLAGRLPTQKR